MQRTLNFWELNDYSCFFGRALDHESADITRKRWNELAKPPGSLGALENAITHLAAIRATVNPTLDHPQCTVFIGDHGVTARGVSAYPSEVNRLMSENFKRGGAVINQICAFEKINFQSVYVFEDKVTHDISETAAMSRAEFEAAFFKGYDAVSSETDLFIAGEMGIGNTTCAAAITCAVLNLLPSAVVGVGAGADDHQVDTKISVIAQALAVNSEPNDNGFDILRKFGGYEFAAIAGAVARTRAENIPFLADGVNIAAVLLALRAVTPRFCEHVIAGHVSAEKSHRSTLDHLGLRPLLDMGMRLGEGSGAAIALSSLRHALNIYRNTARLQELIAS